MSSEEEAPIEHPSNVVERTKSGIYSSHPKRDGYFVQRAKLTNMFIEPNYETIGTVGVVQIRREWQSTLDALWDKACTILENNGFDLETSEPNNPHLATIHHTGFLDALDKAKDHYMKFILACTGKREEQPLVRERESVKEPEEA